MATSLAGKVFVVTGGASGIGLSTMQTLLAKGASVAISDINERGLKQALGLVEEPQRARLIARPLNVANRHLVKAFLEETKNHFGRVDGVANVAGTGGKLIATHELWQLPSDEYDLVMDVNVRGVFNTMAESLKPGFLETRASIVNVGSMFSTRGFKNAVLYSTSKHAVIGLTKSAAMEAGPRGVRVNAVLPGSTDTTLLRETTAKFGDQDPNQHTPIPRLGEPCEIANVIAFLLGPESSFVTGAVWNVDGGANA